MMKEGIKRLFFGIEVHAPWPMTLPKGRVLDETHRHLTLAFLGNIAYQPLLDRLDEFPKFSAAVGTVGFFDTCLLLPHRHPHVVAWHARWLDENDSLITFQHTLTAWLASLNYAIDARPWMAHLTLCRQPFDKGEWMSAFTPLPFYTSHIHLYESTGQLTYVPIWTLSIKPPFEEIAHTADMAFIIRGESLEQIYQNAFAALAFKAPELLTFYKPASSLNNLDSVIMALNAIIGYADGIVGCPMKAVSFHGEIVKLPDSSIQWEMIVDV